MSKIEWDEKYSIGVKALDDQHKRLLVIINELADLGSHEDPKTAMENALWAVLDYAKEHFKFEEGLMLENQYEESEAHRVKHKDLIRQAMELAKKLNTPEGKSTEEMMKFLQNWLFDHILKTDKKFGGYLAEKGVR
jgi:hemerythrin